MEISNYVYARVRPGSLLTQDAYWYVYSYVRFRMYIKKGNTSFDALTRRKMN